MVPFVTVFKIVKLSDEIESAVPTITGFSTKGNTRFYTLDWDFLTMGITKMIRSEIDHFLDENGITWTITNFNERWVFPTIWSTELRHKVRSKILC